MPRPRLGSYTGYRGSRATNAEIRDALDFLAEHIAESHLENRGRGDTVTSEDIADTIYQQFGGNTMGKGEASEFAADVADDPEYKRYVEQRAKQLIRDRRFRRRYAKSLREIAKEDYRGRSDTDMNERMRLNDLAKEIEQDIQRELD